jgi:hypothetical protein
MKSAEGAVNDCVRLCTRYGLLWFGSSKYKPATKSNFELCLSLVAREIVGVHAGEMFTDWRKSTGTHARKYLFYGWLTRPTK